MRFFFGYVVGFAELVRENGDEKGSEEGLAWVSNFNGITGGWESHLFQVLYSLIASSINRCWLQFFYYYHLC